MKLLFFPTLLLFFSLGSFAQLKQYNITAYGAVADNGTINTKSIQAAIDACNANGGGDVVVPTGVFLSGTIHLKSNAEFIPAKRCHITRQYQFK